MQVHWKKIDNFNVIKSMKFTKLVHYIEINVICTVNLQIFCVINVPVIKFNKYLLQNFKAV